MQKQVRTNDIVARIGGEEFLVLMSHCNLKAAAAKADQLRSGLEALTPAGLRVTASFGVAQLSPEIGNFDNLFKVADQAIYRAKQQGRNRVEIAGKM